MEERKDIGRKEEDFSVLLVSAEAPADAAALSELKKQLERFRLPASVRSALPGGTGSIRAVAFRETEAPDREPGAAGEASGEHSSAAVEDTADPAARCGWMAVICSPRLLNSAACMDAVRRFKALRGQERILAVLLEGEPADSFPRELCFRERELKDEQGRTVTDAEGRPVTVTEEVEPLAADLREKDPGKQKKLLEDAVLRLAAPVLGLNYDDLRQRHRERRLRRIAAVSGAAAAVFLVIGCTCLLFAVKTARQKKTIELQQEELNLQYRLQSERYKESMLTVAEELLEQDRQADALYAVRSVLPEDPEEAAESCGPDVQKVLASALGVYSLHRLRRENPERFEQGVRLSQEEIERTLYGDQDPWNRPAVLSDDGKYRLTVEGGRADQSVCFYEGDAGEPVQRLFDVFWNFPAMKKLPDRDGYLLICGQYAYLLDGALEVSAEITDPAAAWRVIGYDAGKTAFLVVDDEKDEEEKYGTRYVPLLSKEELIAGADRLLADYVPSEETLQRYGIM